MSFGTERTEGGMLLAVADKGREKEASRAGKRPKTLKQKKDSHMSVSKAAGSSLNVNSNRSLSSVDKTSLEESIHHG